MSTYNIRLSYSSTEEHIGYHYTAISSYPQSGNYNSEGNVITATCKITELKLIEEFELALEIHTHDSKCEFNGCLGLEAYALANTLALALALALVNELEDELTDSVESQVRAELENVIAVEPPDEMVELEDVNVQELTNKPENKPENKLENKLTNKLEKELTNKLENVQVKLENVQELVENALCELESAMEDKREKIINDNEVQERLWKEGTEGAKAYVAMMDASEKRAGPDDVEELEGALEDALYNAQEELKNVQELKENGN